MHGCLALSAYFGHHAAYGRHGLEARTALLERSEILDLEIASLNAVRERLAGDVALLTAEPPHPDLIEEVARDVLGYTHPRDRIYSTE